MNKMPTIFKRYVRVKLKVHQVECTLNMVRDSATG